MCQSKITNFTVQCNDKNLLGKVTDIRLKQIQTQECLGANPLINWPYVEIQRSHLKSFLKGLLSMCKSAHVTFDVDITKKNYIAGGQQCFLLRNILGLRFNKILVLRINLLTTISFILIS